MAAKRVELLDRGTVGMGFRHRQQDTASGKRAVLVVGVLAEGLPAEQAGIRVEDVIVRVDGQPVPLAEDEVLRRFSRLEPGDVLELVVDRGEERRSYRLTAVEPNERVLSGWLNHYVWNNFPEAEFERYLYITGQASPPPE